MVFRAQKAKSHRLDELHSLFAKKRIEKAADLFSGFSGGDLTFFNTAKKFRT
jgi:hypothetical protein